MGRADSFYTADQIKERLSISTLAFYRYRPVGEGALRELARHGITRIELLESPQQFDLADADSMRVFGDSCRSCGVQVAAYHAMEVNFSDLDTEEKRIERVDLCRRQIDTMLELGGTLWASHARLADATLLKCYEELARHVEGTDAVIAVENFGGPGMGVEDRMAFLDRIDHPQVGMVLDIGHVRNTDGGNPMTLPRGPAAVLELCGRRLRHLHLHGFKETCDHWPPLVEGDQIQWVELFDMLRTVGYPGDINFEPSWHPGVIEAVAAAPERIVTMAMAH